MVSFVKRLLFGRPEVPDNIHAGSYPFLVTGCARSGTHFMAKFLQLNDLNLGHEATTELGTVHWLCASEDYCRDRGAEFQKTLHLVRNPAHVFKSLQTINPRAWNFIRRYAPQCSDDDKKMAAAKYWVEWNKMALARADLTVRVEDFSTRPEETVRALSGFFDRPLDPAQIDTARLSGDSRKRNRDYGHDVTLEYVRDKNPALFNDIVDLAGRLNYGEDDLAVAAA